MPPETAGFDRVRQLAAKLPDVEEGTAWNGPRLSVRGKMFTCMAIHRSAEPGSLAVVVGEDARDELIEGDPEIYYTKDHYVPWPIVLVRLSTIDDDALRDLLMMGWRYASEHAPRRKRATPRSARRQV